MKLYTPTFLWWGKQLDLMNCVYGQVFLVLRNETTHVDRVDVNVAITGNFGKTEFHEEIVKADLIRRVARIEIEKDESDFGNVDAGKRRMIDFSNFDSVEKIWRK